MTDEAVVKRAGAEVGVQVAEVLLAEVQVLELAELAPHELSE